MKKYVIIPTGTHFQSGYIIRAIRSFGDVKAGDIGGFFKGKVKLNHKGNCWVSKGVNVLCSSISGDVQILNSDPDNIYSVIAYSTINGSGIIKDSKIYQTDIISKNINLKKAYIATSNIYGHNITITDSKVRDSTIKGKCVISSSKVRYCKISKETSIAQGEWYNKKMYGGSWIF